MNICIYIVVALLSFALGRRTRREPDANTVPARWTEDQRRLWRIFQSNLNSLQDVWDKKAAFCTVLTELKAADAQLIEEAMLLHAAGDKDANGEPKDPDDPIWPKFYKLYHRFKYLRALASAVANFGLPLLDEERDIQRYNAFLDDECVRAGMFEKLTP
jgi:hypothetical protein